MRLVANGKTNCIVYDVTIDWVYQFVERASKNISVLQSTMASLKAGICFRRMESNAALHSFRRALTKTLLAYFMPLVSFNTPREH